MADTETQQEPILPVKRKSDLSCENEDTFPNKSLKQQHQPVDTTTPSAPAQEILKGKSVEQGEDNGEIKPQNLDSSKISSDLSDFQEKSAGLAVEDEEDDAGEDYAEEEDEDEEEADDDDELSVEAEVDRKGKGISREDKGKGKLIVEDDSEDEDDDDSSDGGSESEDVSDLSDDPLAEVDLGNILPSWTRSRRGRPGVFISDKGGNNDSDA